MTAGASCSFRYRKRPVVVEARQVSPENFRDVASWCGGTYGFRAGVPTVEIATLEGVMTATCGDRVVKGVAGEFHPVRGSIFARTYDPVRERTGAEVVNWQQACRNGSGGITVAEPARFMTREQALAHAAHLVALADEDGEFADYLEAVRRAGGG